MTESQPAAERNLLAVVGAIGGGIIGMAVGRYSGMSLIIPLGLAFVAGVIGSKLGPRTSQPMVAAFAVQTGHGLWMALGLALLGTFDLNVVDIVILLIGASWLLVRPGIAPVLLLTAYQLVGLPINFLAFTSAEFATLQHKTLLVHVLVRVLALVLMYAGLYRIRQAENAAREPSE